MKFPLLKSTDVAKMLNVTVRTLHVWAKDQHIPAYNFGTDKNAAWRFDSDELMHWMESRRSDGGYLK
jgi:excisionase family DNA binding protein